LPDAACPGHSEPLDAAIGELPAQYCPGSRQGNNQQNNNDTMYYLLLTILMTIAIQR
jgi:hypothetical protein